MDFCFALLCVLSQNRHKLWPLQEEQIEVKTTFLFNFCVFFHLQSFKVWMRADFVSTKTQIWFLLSIGTRYFFSEFYQISKCRTNYEKPRFDFDDVGLWICSFSLLLNIEKVLFCFLVKPHLFFLGTKY